MRQVNLPPGCESLKMQDGTVYNGRPGGRVTVEDGHGDAIARTLGGDAGLVGSGRFGAFLGTRKGRACTSCHRVWQAWSSECPRCGTATVACDAGQDQLYDELVGAEDEPHGQRLQDSLDALAGDPAYARSLRRHEVVVLPAA